jgi:ribosomal protein L30E
MAGGNVYDPATGKVTSGVKATVKAMIYAEAYTARECADIPSVMQGDVKIYAPGQAWGYETTALLQMQVREIVR